MIGETIGNPGLEVLDIPKVAEIAHAANIPLLIDNTFATPYLSRPIELGADIVMHSVTKWIGGHGIAIGGIVVDGGRFDWHGSGKFPTLTEPYAGYHGIVFDEQFGPPAFIIRARDGRPARFRRLPVADQRVPPAARRRDAAACAWSGTSRTPRRCSSFLAAHKAVDWVLHPSLESHPDHELAKRLLPKGAGSIVIVRHQGRPRRRPEVHRGAAAGQPSRQCRRRQDAGDPSGVAPRISRWSAEQLNAAGVGEELVRLSVGLESASDIIDDLGQALRASQRG